MSVDLNNVSTKFQFDFPRNNSIINAGSLFSHFSGSLLIFRRFKMLGNTAVVAIATKFLYLENESSPK